MKILISPAKTLDFNSNIQSSLNSEPVFIENANRIAKVMMQFNTNGIAKLMSVSTQLANLNFERYQHWFHNETPLRQAVLAFKGDVYQGLEPETFTQSDMEYAQEHLRILSGLYGILRPADLIKPHRLEMGTQLEFDQYKNLYQYWGNTLTKKLDEELKYATDRFVVNLASKEYASSIDFKALSAKVISPEFKDYKNGQYKIISFFAKKARGRMAAFLIRNRINDHNDIAAFSEDGYIYNAQVSKPAKPVFTRG